MPAKLPNIADSALAFRGYNITNLGRTRELLAVPAYAGGIHEEMTRFSDICSELYRDMEVVWICCMPPVRFLFDENAEPRGLENVLVAGLNTGWFSVMT